MAVESGYIRNGVAPGGRAELLDDDATVELDLVTGEEDKSPWLRLRPPAEPEPLPAGVKRQEADPFRYGATLRDRYRIEDIIGGGGCAVIYRARDLRCEAADGEDARVAIKTLRPELRGSQPAIARLKREFRALRLISHQNVVRVFDLDSHETDWFAVMELLEGESLAAWLRRHTGSRMPDGEALGVLTACADGLACAHGHGIVHGDIKPDNIFLLRSGGLRLLDFGALSEATHGEEPMRVKGETILATPAYASPQLLSGLPPDPRDDVFSLSCVAFELLTGRHPYARLDALTAAARGLRPLKVAGLGHGRAATLASGLAARREDRPAGVRELVARLMAPDTASHGASAAGLPASPAAALPPPRPRMTVTTVALLVTLAAVTAAAFLYYRSALPLPDRQPVVQPVSPATAPPGGHPQSRAAVQKDLASPAQAIGAGDAEVSVQPLQLPASPAVTTTLGDPQRVSFRTATLTVSRASNWAAIPLWRSGSSAGRINVRWLLSTKTAVAERDFSGPTSGVVPFADGQEANTIFVPLVPNSTKSGQREFTVKIQGVGAPAQAGDLSNITVQIR